ncbi:MAG TPA: Hsp33 family molecular chaperone HslO [Alphaproteobacteria bacterium]
MSRIANDNSDDSRDLSPDDNIIQPFQLEASGLRGRVVRLGTVLNDILSAHSYPSAVAHLLAETVATSLLLSSMLKYEGIFTLQASAEGPVRTIVADVATSGAVRGYAGYGEDLIRAMEHAAKGNTGGPYEGFDLRQMTGKGYLAFTVDQGANTDRYQGIVELTGEMLADSVQNYFNQSEQIGTTLKVAATYDDKSGWRAGAIMLQRMPDPSIGVQKTEHVLPFHGEAGKEKEEDWNRSSILLQSVVPSELVSPDLHSHDLLVRLFHEEGVRIFTPQPVFKSCRCSVERVQQVLSTLGPEDREHASSNGVIEMTCEFCSKTYRFNATDLSYVDDESHAKKH